MQRVNSVATPMSLFLSGTFGGRVYIYMVLSVNKFQNILQKGACDAAGFLNLERGQVRYDHPAIDGTTDIKLLLPQWGYTAQTLLVVRWQKCADCSSDQEHVPKVLMRHGDPGHCLHGRLERRDKSHGGKHKLGQSASTESRRTNPYSSA